MAIKIGVILFLFFLKFNTGSKVTKLLGFQKNNLGTTSSSCTILFLDGKGGYFEKLSWGSETLDMTFERFGEMFESDFAEHLIVLETLL